MPARWALPIAHKRDVRLFTKHGIIAGLARPVGFVQGMSMIVVLNRLCLRWMIPLVGVILVPFRLLKATRSRRRGMRQLRWHAITGILHTFNLAILGERMAACGFRGGPMRVF